MYMYIILFDAQVCFNAALKPENYINKTRKLFDPREMPETLHALTNTQT